MQQRLRLQTSARREMAKLLAASSRLTIRDRQNARFFTVSISAR